MGSNRQMDVVDRSDFKAAMNRRLALALSRTVVLTIDLQREYLDESVGQSVVETEEAERVLQANERLLGTARARGIPVVHAYVERSRHEHEAGFHSGGLAYLGAAHEGGISQMPHRPPRSRLDRPEGAFESQVPTRLVAPSDIHVTDKKSLDSFAHTELGFLFSRILRPEFVIITGINTDTCVHSTTFTVANLGYSPVVVADCVASMRGRDSHEMALELMSRSIAWVLTLEEVLERLG